ncbi:hypothetical protein PS624_05604 [Pseudomonas fluorescens]|uniref:Uncharacterized protein n=1 Tax=Pseudomonas fluorescens TaxID=294 RepID=A0A5E6XTR7_PSEFL|nr:hypothetical protein PS624_05604 [Pseudomonas fluorescens]
MAQGGNILRLQILELATGAAGLAVEGTYLQFNVHGDAEVVDDELQTRLVHLANGQLKLPGVERQTTGRQGDDPRFKRRPVWTEEAQLGRDVNAGVLALGFGFMHYVGVDGGIHRGDFLVNSIGAGQTIISSTATKMLPAEKVMVRDDQVLNQR